MTGAWYHDDPESRDEPSHGSHLAWERGVGETCNLQCLTPLSLLAPLSYRPMSRGWGEESTAGEFPAEDIERKHPNRSVLEHLTAEVDADGTLEHLAVE